MAASSGYLYIFSVLAILMLSSSLEEGKWQINVTVSKEEIYLPVKKTLYNESEVTFKISCSANATLTVGWMLRWSPCVEEYVHINQLQLEGPQAEVPILSFYYSSPDQQRMKGYTYKDVQYIKREKQIIHCDSGKMALTPLDTVIPARMIQLPQDPEKDTPPSDAAQVKPPPGKAQVKPPPGQSKDSEKDTPPSGEAQVKPPPGKAQVKPPPGKAQVKPPSGQSKTRKKREDSKKPTPKPAAPSTTPSTPKPVIPEDKIDPSSTTTASTPKPMISKDKYLLTHAWRDGVFLFILQLKAEKEVNVEVEIEMENTHGYLSAVHWPLLIFYGVMCIVYVLLGLLWLVLLACNWRDLLRVQFWIGGVIVLGMLEKAVFYAEYQSVNNTGKSVPGAYIFATLVSCCKRTIARMLVIIVSLGFGVVKPRLGPMLHKVLGLGSLYFICASVEGIYTAVYSIEDQSAFRIIVGVPLALIDAIICWWVFSSLVETLRSLRLRRNIVKLSIYRHFTNVLVFAVLASIAFMVWSYTQHRAKICITGWKELWVDDAYWHLLFSIILVVIMVLWRPTANNQRYAFSPLLDAADDEEDEDVIMSDAFHGMKMRGSKNGSPRQSSSSKAEDDLKWVEDNIPVSLLNKVVVDSDEEVVTTKMEMSKME